MAGEIQAAFSIAGATLYAQVRNSVGQIWNTASAAFQAYATANIADYDIALAQQGTASHYYAGDIPAIIAGTYQVVVLLRAGASPAESDRFVGAGTYEWDGSAVIPLSSKLSPTVAGRTLDVTATGAAGVDWANVENPTTVQGLSGTTIKTATDVETDTADIQARLPASLSEGRMRSKVEAMDANTLTASALAADAVTEIQAGLATSAALSFVQADTDDIQSRLPAALFGGRMDSSIGALAADSITAASLATSAVDEIAAAVWALALETGFSASRIMRIIGAATAGKASGGAGSPVIRNLGDTLDQVTGTADSSGNRTAASYGA